MLVDQVRVNEAVQNQCPASMRHYFIKLGKTLPIE